MGILHNFSNQLSFNRKNVLIYRSLQIFNGRINETLASVILPAAKFNLGLAHISINVTFMILLKNPNFYLFPCFIGIVAMTWSEVTFWDLSAKVYEVSFKFQNYDFSFSRTERPLLQKYAKSCRRLAFEVGHFYLLSRSTTLTYLNLVANYTLNYLLLTKAIGS